MASDNRRMQLVVAADDPFRGVREVSGGVVEP